MFFTNLQRITGKLENESGLVTGHRLFLFGTGSRPGFLSDSTSQTLAHKGLVRFIPSRPGWGLNPRVSAGISPVGVKSRPLLKTCSVKPAREYTPRYSPPIPSISQGFKTSTLTPWNRSPNRYGSQKRSPSLSRRLRWRNGTSRLDLGGGRGGVAGRRCVGVNLANGGGGGTARGRGGPPRRRQWRDNDGSWWTSAAMAVDGRRRVSPWCSAATAVEGRRRVGVELGIQPAGRGTREECVAELLGLTEHNFRTQIEEN
jgi:hypothetical protein